MRNKTVFIVISIVILFLIAVAVYTVYTPNAENQDISPVTTETSPETASSLPEVTVITTAAETISPPSTTSEPESIETTTEDTSKNLPTLKLVIYEGPVIVGNGDICYYRIEAIATGQPYPAIKFSKDDSNGTWGKNKAQVNLNNGESYTLVVTATNTAGTVTKHLDLTWSQ